MKMIKIRVIPNARKNDVSPEGEGLKVRVNAPPLGGRANKAVIEALADFFKVKKRSIKIVRGERSREKVIALDTKAANTKKQLPVPVKKKSLKC
jgi:uncharacterized protein (TIGR00251 family)